MKDKNESAEIFKLIAWHQSQTQPQTSAFKTDDLVSSIRHGPGRVITDHQSDHRYPVRVLFDEAQQRSFSYTSNGKYGGREDDNNYAVTHINPPEPDNLDWHTVEITRLRAILKTETHKNFPVGAQVTSEQYGKGRVKSHQNNNMVIEFRDGTTYNYNPINGYFKGHPHDTRRQVHAT